MRKQAFLFLSLLLATGLLFASCASQTTRKGSSANSSSPANAEHTETQTSVSGGGTLPAGATTAGTCPSATDRIPDATEESTATETTWPKTDQMIKTEQILALQSIGSVAPLITTAYSQEELLRDVFFGGTDNFNTMLNYIAEKFPLECIRTFEKDGSLPYCIYKLREGGRLYIFFHGGGLWFADSVFIIKEPLSQNDFKKITPGKSLADVLKIDEGARLYNEAHPETFGVLLKTVHLVKDGFLMISYQKPAGEWERNWYDIYSQKDIRIESVEFIPNGNPLWADGGRYTLLEQDFPS